MGNSNRFGLTGAFLAGMFMAAMPMGTAALAQNAQVVKGPVPVWAVQSDLLPLPEKPAGAIFIRRQDTQIHLDEKGQALFLDYRAKILNSAALQLGNLSITWNPAAGAPVVHVIRIHREGETIDILPKASFEVLRREDQLEAARLDGNLTAVLRIQDLRVGDELEFGATIRSSDPTLGNTDAGMLTLAAEPAPGRFHLRLGWDKGQEPQIRMSEDMKPMAKTLPQAIDVMVDNPAPLVPPTDAPPRYLWQRMIEFSRFADWPGVSRHFAPLYASASTLDANSPLRAEAARIAAAQKAPFDRLAAALELVQQNVRYIYVGLNGGNLTPAAADETWQRRYGDCKAKTVLLLALLRELGIDAQAVLVNTTGMDDGFDQRLASPNLFDHVVVRATLEGRTYWLDGTLPAVVGPGAQPFLPYRWVLPITAQGSTLERRPWTPAARPNLVSLYEIDARTGFDKPARITSTTITRGVAGLEQEMQLSAVTPVQLLSAFRQKAIGNVWQAIEDVQWHYDQKTQASVLTIIGTGMVDWENDGGNARSLALPGGGFSPPEKRLRPAEQNQEMPFFQKAEYDCRVTTVRLPLWTTPAQWSHKDDIDTRMFGRAYYRAFDLRDGALRMVRGTRTEEPEISAAIARRDNDRIAHFDNSMGYIFYNPKGRNMPGGKGKSVPATYDIDWAADDAACLAAAPTPKS